MKICDGNDNYKSIETRKISANFSNRNHEEFINRFLQLSYGYIAAFSIRATMFDFVANNEFNCVYWSY